MMRFRKKKENIKPMGLFQLQDYMFALKLLGTGDVDFFICVIELRCDKTEQEAILMPLLMSEDEDEIKKAMGMFYSKLTPEELKKYKIKYVGISYPD